MFYKEVLLARTGLSIVSFILGISLSTISGSGFNDSLGLATTLALAGTVGTGATVKYLSLCLFSPLSILSQIPAYCYQLFYFNFFAAVYIWLSHLDFSPYSGTWSSLNQCQRKRYLRIDRAILGPEFSNFACILYRLDKSLVVFFASDRHETATRFLILLGILFIAIDLLKDIAPDELTLDMFRAVSIFFRWAFGVRRSSCRRSFSQLGYFSVQFVLDRISNESDLQAYP